MTKRGYVLLFVVVVLASVAVGAREPSPEFAMEVRRTATGITAKCNQGCDWISVSAACDEGKKCYFLVTQRGVRSIPEP